MVACTAVSGRRAGCVLCPPFQTAYEDDERTGEANYGRWTTLPYKLLGDDREAIAYAPMEGRYKVFIIDEAHMLTRESFNALLKTLEEPPPRATFILATTEAHKFPITIVSRCQHFIFKAIPEADWWPI